MKKTIISGVTNGSPGIPFLNLLIAGIQKKHEIQLFEIHKMDISFCTGCWGCWVKTPGECIIKDEMHRILKGMINSDLVIFVSPITLGYVNGPVKKIMDRTIPLVHPYIEMVENECHHLKRYQKYPGIGLIMDIQQKIEGVEKDILKKLFQRYALNFKTELKIFATSLDPLKEVFDEINSI